MIKLWKIKTGEQKAAKLFATGISNILLEIRSDDQSEIFIIDNIDKNRLTIVDYR